MVIAQCSVCGTILCLQGQAELQAREAYALTADEPGPVLIAWCSPECSCADEPLLEEILS